MTRFLSALILLSPLSAVRAEDTPKVDPYDQSKVALEVEPPADFKGKRVLVIAGSRSHGPGDHEFFAGSAILMNLLKQTPGVFPIMARDGWPKNEKLFDTADCIVMYMDGGGGHPAIKPDRMKLIQKQLDRGCGWVNIHYAVEYPVKQGDRDIAGPVKAGSAATTKPDTRSTRTGTRTSAALPTHAITHGVKPFTIRDEWYYGMRWADDMKGVTPILQALPPDNTRGTDVHEDPQGRDSKRWPGPSSARTRAAVSASPAGTSTGTGATKTSAAWW